MATSTWDPACTTATFRIPNAGSSLDAVGLLALADLSTIARRTALTGSASIFDILVLAPGIHTQQKAPDVNHGELPATGAMTSGYVFRIENQAMVSYIQSVGKPGCLVTVSIVKEEHRSWLFALFGSVLRRNAIVASLLYLSCITITIASFTLLLAIEDHWAVGVLLMLVCARFLNMVVIKRRAQLGWKGVPEPGVKGDLLVLLSQDRWIRIRGLVDDLKAVASGQWLGDPTDIESFATAFATLLVYASAVLAFNASTIGSLCIATLLVASAALLGVCNSLTRDLQLFGRRVYVAQGPRKYARRLDLAKELIDESGRDDWAIAMGLVQPSDAVAPPKVTM
ncbi:hypothetical protein PUNSTDRAFT_120042 [Punctularia strigosozonata HHB-11173 SS5]|uniref:uncharacterized protein n=1 Tax=Punctularia strigosozonata (strain HHB-11173) TaxID=741275 RepID=UPI000441705C|nr:uncharacterized protein PUNSTDRAFT_120042 [Punctularia strigosozonata HHB-11173 SS5]EIN09606.1 hypothetical protein PUNSTDRAFT_120042 [Punctularia strigosozonata HHB-11173 SS5]